MSSWNVTMGSWPSPILVDVRVCLLVWLFLHVVPLCSRINIFNLNCTRLYNSWKDRFNFSCCISVSFANPKLNITRIATYINILKNIYIQGMGEKLHPRFLCGSIIYLCLNFDIRRNDPFRNGGPICHSSFNQKYVCYPNNTVLHKGQTIGIFPWFRLKHPQQSDSDISSWSEPFITIPAFTQRGSQ